MVAIVVVPKELEETIKADLSAPKSSFHLKPLVF
jgi:hypothetical protein